jgi:hypothetical protein
MIGSVVTGIGAPKVRYYNPFFNLGTGFIVAGSILLRNINEETTWPTVALFESLLGFGIGLFMLANVVPCQTLLAEQYHSISHGLTFLSCRLGS